MTERLFAVHEQREIFMLMLWSGFGLGILLDGRTLMRRALPRLGIVWDMLAAAGWFIMMLAILLRTHEGVRLYGLLGTAIGALIYRIGVSQVMRGAAHLLKKAAHSRKSDP